MIYVLKAYINKEMTMVSYFDNLLSATACANHYEDGGYICEIEAYEYHKTVSREFWREARNDNPN